jgi:aminopeptidase
MIAEREPCKRGRGACSYVSDATPIASRAMLIARPAEPYSDYLRALAELAVRLGANVQPGQIVAISSEPGKEPLARAVAEVAYRQGARFVDMSVFDIHLKRARVLYAAPDTLGFVPPWYGERMLALGEHRCARIGFTGLAAPHALDGLDPVSVGRDMLPTIPESAKVLSDRTTNWTAVPCPTQAWAEVVHPELEPGAALERLWDQIAHVCRLDEPDPIAAWEARLAALEAAARRLDDLRLDELRFEGPGTSLSVGLLPGSRWVSGRIATVDGIVHAANLPTEEVFTTPDPARVRGTVRSTKPLRVAGTTIEGLRMRFEGGRAVEIEADRGAETLRTIAGRDPGAARLGEVALVDNAGRIGPLGTVFHDTLLDENAASHIALGQGLSFTFSDEHAAARMNDSEIHVDFMIGSDAVAVTGVRHDGSELPLLRNGSWHSDLQPPPAIR